MTAYSVKQITPDEVLKKMNNGKTIEILDVIAVNMSGGMLQWSGAVKYGK